MRRYYFLKIQELEKLRYMLLNNEITAKEASEAVYSSMTKSWQQKEWAAMRSEKIKGSCEQCESQLEPLVLQHNWHPRSYKKVKYDTIAKYGELVNQEFPKNVLVHEHEVASYQAAIKTVDTDVCPNCFSNNLRLRKTKSPKYICNHCKLETDELITRLIPFFIDDRMEAVPQEIRNAITYSQIEWYLYKEKAKDLLFEKYEDVIEMETILTIIDESLRYQSLVDTVTFCKKCAFLWDKKNQDLCPKCKQKYKNRGASYCYECRDRNHVNITSDERAERLQLLNDILSQNKR